MKTKSWLGIVSGLVLFSGCADQLTEQQRLWLAEGERAYGHQRYAVAAEKLARFASTVDEGPTLARARYVRGMALARNGQRVAGYAELEQAARIGRDTDIGWRAEAVLGIMHFEDEHWPEASRHLESAVAKMPSAPPMDALLYRLGLCFERCGRWSDALEAYRHVARAFSRGEYADRAQRRLQLRADHLAIQAGVFSDPDRAQRLARELNNDGFDAFVRQELRGDRSYHVVLVGKTQSYDAAVATLRRIRGKIPGAVLWP